MAASIDRLRADDVKRRMQFAEAAQALAGLELTDQTLRESCHRVAAGNISADDAIRAGIAQFDAL